MRKLEVFNKTVKQLNCHAQLVGGMNWNNQFRNLAICTQTGYIDTQEPLSLSLVMHLKDTNMCA